MNRLRQPGDSDYDVLGLSPGATDEEIEIAFRQLIDGEGYRVGIPLNRQWLRAHQIKHAHALLSDPAKRRAYDESLSRADGALWVAATDDPAPVELVLPTPKPRRARPIKNRPAPVALVPSDAVRTSSRPKKAPDRAPRPDAEETARPIGKGPPSPAALVPSEAVRTSSRPKKAPDRTPRPDAEETARPIGKGPPSPDLSPPLNDNEGGPAPASVDNRKASVRSWGLTAVLAVGLGLVLIPSWLQGDRQPSSIERAREITLDGQRASVAGRGSEATAQQAGEPIPRDMADAQSPSTAKPADIAPPAAKPSSLPEKAAEARAIAPDQKPAAARSPAIKDARVRAVGPSRPVGRAPQWIGGGPTDADNPRGRYQGTVALQVNVVPSGRVSNCAPVRGSGDAKLDKLTCRLVRQRARFIPARDPQGRPVMGQAYITFAWVRR